MPDIDVNEGLYVVLRNSSDETINAGGWRLNVKSGSTDESFTFPRSAKISGMGRLRIISSQASHMHTRDDLIWSNFQLVDAEATVELALANKAGDVQCRAIIK